MTAHDCAVRAWLLRAGVREAARRLRLEHTTEAQRAYWAIRWEEAEADWDRAVAEEWESRGRTLPLP